VAASAEAVESSRAPKDPWRVDLAEADGRRTAGGDGAALASAEVDEPFAVGDVGAADVRKVADAAGGDGAALASAEVAELFAVGDVGAADICKVADAACGDGAALASAEVGELFAVGAAAATAGRVDAATSGSIIATAHRWQ